MTFWQFIISLRELIHIGQKWQQLKIVGASDVKGYKFSFLQILGLLMAGLYVYRNPEGVSDTEIDFLLSSLSIITGFFFAVIFLGFDQFDKIVVPTAESSQELKIKTLKSMNFLKKYNALSCYAILLSVTVIIMLVVTLLYGDKINISENYRVAQSYSEIEWKITLKYWALIAWRFSMIYFLFDFFIMTVYAICSLFQFINVQMLERDLPYSIEPSHVAGDYYSYKKRYGCLGVVGLMLFMAFLAFMISLIVCL